MPTTHNAIYKYLFRVFNTNLVIVFVFSHSHVYLQFYLLVACRKQMPRVALIVVVVR